jgi:hypothetical protein
VAVAQVGARVGDVKGNLAIARRYLRPRLVVATLHDLAVEASGGAGGDLRQRRLETYAGLLEARA